MTTISGNKRLKTTASVDGSSGSSIGGGGNSLGINDVPETVIISSLLKYLDKVSERG